jgi:hypothetical protein
VRRTQRAASQEQEVPKPDPALKRLERLVGTWKMKGRTLGSKEENISATTTFKWLHADADKSFFLQQDMDMDYAGTRIRSHELIGYNPKTKAFSSLVFSNMAAEPWPYEWDVRDDVVTISVKYGLMDAKYTGKFSADGKSFSGGWRPDVGADETINAPYDITASRSD